MRKGSLRLLLAAAVLYGYGGCNGNGLFFEDGRHDMPTHNTNFNANNPSGSSTGGTGGTNTNTGGSNTDPSGGGSGSTDPHVTAALASINNIRAQHGLTALVTDATMNTCALRHSQDAAACAGNNFNNFGNCAHTDFINGDTCGGITENTGIAGQTNTSNQDVSYQSVQNGWVSEGPPPAGQSNHYSNLLDPNIKTVGIGLYIDPNGNLWVTEDYK